MTVTGADLASYAFGDSDIAAQRLECLGRVFAGSTRAFLQRSAGSPAGLVIDLGCGPGHSTRFLAEVLPSRRVVGIDNSGHFIALAQSRATERVTFHRHDFTLVPFPIGPADLLYARFELSHVREPEAVVQGWASQLCRGGRLLLEETEWIRTTHPTFAAYLEIVEAMLDHQGTKLYVGPDLERLPHTPILRRRESLLCRFRVHSRDAATMFFLNIQTWKHHPFVQASYPSAAVEQLERDLERLTRCAGEAPEIEWGLRQLAFARR